MNSFLEKQSLTEDGNIINEEPSNSLKPAWTIYLSKYVEVVSKLKNQNNWTEDLVVIIQSLRLFTER